MPSPWPTGRSAQRVDEGFDDFGVEVGGPILRDRLWFYFGFAPVLNHLVGERYTQALTEDPANRGQPLTDPRTGLTQGTRVGPSSPTTSPLLTSSETSFTTVRDLKRFCN